MTLLSKISWEFNDEYYTDKDKFNTDISQDDWNPDEIIHNYPEFNFIYYATVYSRYDILPNEIKKKRKYGRHEMLANLKADNGEYFTAVELLMKIHNQLSNKFLDDHFFFEGIDLTKMIKDGTEPFIIFCGS